MTVYSTPLLSLHLAFCRCRPLPFCVPLLRPFCSQHVTPEEAAWVKANYVNPAFKVDEAEHAALVSNAAAVDARLNGTGDLNLAEDDMARIDSEAF